MAAASLTAEEMKTARATLAVLREAPEVRDALATPAGAPDPVRGLVRGGAWRIVAAAACAGGVVWILSGASPLHGRLAARLVLLLGAGAVALLVHAVVRWRRAAVVSDAVMGASLVVVASRSRDLSDDGKGTERFHAALSTDTGNRIVLRHLDPGRWRQFVPGAAFIVWMRGPELVDVRDLGPAVEIPADRARPPR